MISCRCIFVEDDLVHLKQRLAKSEASQKSLNRAVFELNKEKRDFLGAMEAVKAELLAKEGDVKAAVDARDEVVKEMKHLMGQMEGARAAAMSDYKASEAFTDNNLQCFYSYFEAFRKQAKERYPDVDFSEFQPYDDTDSVNEGNEKGTMLTKPTMPPPDFIQSRFPSFSSFMYFYKQFALWGLCFGPLFSCSNNSFLF